MRAGGCRILLSRALGLAFAVLILNKVGLPTLVDGVVHHSKTLEDRGEIATPGMPR